jgi:hypothetical protein
MKILSLSKDGGPESTVWAYWLCEFKSLFSVVLLRFDNGTRDAYHSHAFDAVSWVLRGRLVEICIGCQTPGIRTYTPHVRPIVTRRDTFHMVRSVGRTWVLSFRGPWVDRWREYTIEGGTRTLTHGRKVVGS